jgi:hypothetical protein
MRPTQSPNSFCKNVRNELYSGIAMNKLWGVIKSLQIILLLPLTRAHIPPNVQLLYYFMNSNFNIEIVPSTTLSFSFLPLYGGDYQSASSFSTEFENEDIF